MTTRHMTEVSSPFLTLDCVFDVLRLRFFGFRLCILFLESSLLINTITTGWQWTSTRISLHRFDVTPMFSFTGRIVRILSTKSCSFRLLSAAIGLNTIPRSFHEVDTMQNIINNLNYRHRNAQLASRDSASLYTILFFR